jgi:hypothetical protein
VDVEAAFVGYSSRLCSPANVRVLDLGRSDPRAVFASRVRSCCASARLAGRYLAWLEPSSLVVEDWRARRVAYRVSLPYSPRAVDVQSDGKSVVLFQDGRIAWFSHSDDRPHFLSFRAAQDAEEVRIALDRIAVVRGTAVGGERDLVVSNLAGHLRSIAAFGSNDRLSTDFAFQQSDISFDGSRIAWAADHATKRHEDCPPPPSLAPCRMHWEGTRTIWLEQIGERAKPLARLLFDDPRYGQGR